MKKALFPLVFLFAVGFAAAQNRADFGTFSVTPDRDAHAGDLRAFLEMRPNAPALDSAYAENFRLWAFKSSDEAHPFTIPAPSHPDAGDFLKVVVFYEIQAASGMWIFQKMEMPGPWPRSKEIPIHFGLNGWIEVVGASCAAVRHFHFSNNYRQIRADLQQVVCIE